MSPEPVSVQTKASTQNVEGCPSKKEFTVDDLPSLSKTSAKHMCDPYKIILALPGSGKTTCVKWINSPFEDEPGARPTLDLDIRGPKGANQPQAMSAALSHYIRAAVNSQVTVFSFLHYFQWGGIPNVPVLVVLPNDEAVATQKERLLARDKGQPFAREAAANFEKWNKEWALEVARLKDTGRNITVEYLSPGEYLLDVIRRLHHD